MNIIKKWYIKHKIKHFFKKEYPVSHSYEAMLMYLNLCDSQEILNVFTELQYENEIKVDNSKLFYTEYIYNHIKHIKDW